MDRNVSYMYLILLFESLQYLPFYKATTKRTFPDFKFFVLHNLKPDKFKTLREIQFTT